MVLFLFSFRKVQEKLSNVGIGSIPRSISVCLDDDLADRCKPGDDVQIQGSVTLRRKNIGLVSTSILWLQKVEFTLYF